MDQVKLPLPLQCPDHKDEVIGMVNMDPNAKKIGYCFDCIHEEGGDGSFLKNLKPVREYLKYCSKVYENGPKRVNVERPAEYVDELSKKGERLEKFSQHLDQEKNKVMKSFEEIRKIVLQIINEKEKECLELFDKEIFCLSEMYRNSEKLLKMGWPEDSDVENIYPGIDILKQRMSQIKNIDQLRAFMTGIQEDVRIQDLYFVEDDDLVKLKKKMDGLTHGFSIPEGSFPKIQGQIFNSENLENFMKDLMKGFSQQEVKVENSIASRMKASIYESKIILEDQFETLRDWLPKGYKFDLKLLFRGSADGMSTQKIHEKCDGKGATITLAKCRFDGAPGPHTLGGFLDQSWHSQNSYSSSREAFLFSLGKQQATSIKCPILETESESAFYGGLAYGPYFGYQGDFCIYEGFATGSIIPSSYSNTIDLRNGYGDKFSVEEVEVFQVQ